MSKIQAYIYIAVISAALFGAAVVWNARKTNQQPITSPQPSNSAAAEVSIKYNSDGSIDTSDWLTFRHEVYPYEIKYPEDGKIKSLYFYYDDNTPSLLGQRTDVEIREKSSDHSVIINSDFIARSPDVRRGFDLKKYVTRKSQFEPGEAPLLKNVSKVKEVIGSNWQGYGYTFVQDNPSSDEDFIDTFLYILHNEKLYRVEYNENDLIETTIVKTLRFVE